MTEFKCKICNQEIGFDLDDSSTYLTKSESGNPLIGKLYTVRVGHSGGPNIQHINVVVVDERGEYRAHKDSYVESDTSTEAVTFEKISQEFPSEIKPYLSLASESDRKLIASVNTPLDYTADGWTRLISQLYEKSPSSRLFELILAKWNFIVGNGSEIPHGASLPESWGYPLYLRFRCRVSGSPELLEMTQNLQFDSFPPLVQFEIAMAKAENFLRMASFESLDSLFDYVQKNWGDTDLVQEKVALLVVQAYWGFSQYRKGDVGKALSMLEPAFSFGQIINNREIISVVGTLYANVLRATGDLSTALDVYQVALDTITELGDNRGEVVLSINMSIVEYKQGKFEQSLQRQKETLSSLIAQREFLIRNTILNNMSENLLALERYEESRKIAQDALAEENLPIDLRMALLANLKLIAGKTESLELLTWIKDNLPEHEYMTSPRGIIFQHDLDAIDAELHQNWETMIDSLKKELAIVTENKLTEEANDIELRIAEGYFTRFQESNDMQYLNEAYKHLEMAKTLALESQYYSDLCRLAIIKGLLAIQANLSERARAHFEEALSISRQYELISLESQVLEHIERFEQGELERESSSTLRSLFQRLTFRRTEERKKRRPSNVFSIWISKRNTVWELLLQNKEIGTSEYTNYLLGLVDLWDKIGRHSVQEGVDSYQGSRGYVIIESSPEYDVIVLSDQIDYILRTSMQDILEEIESFPLKHIDEELTAKALSIIENRIGTFEKMSLL
ncbi:MAG: hypothetical protein BAJATHORv1_20038 [Candidatus Thorarchaeota archaeon]|nr:MAG: hypothetical protein BAJATHORv1_20038 [Candidatus Thorarchaeota archaeon]